MAKAQSAGKRFLQETGAGNEYHTAPRVITGLSFCPKGLYSWCNSAIFQKERLSIINQAST